MKEEQPGAAPEKETAAPKSATAPKRRYKYVGQPTRELHLPNLSGSINPETVTDEHLDVLIRRFPALSQLFEKV
jgi:hypothetical protein